MFSLVSVCPRGVSAPLHARIHSPPGSEADTPRQTPPPWADNPPGQTTPLRSACWDTVNKRAVRMPLECILVLLLNTQSNHTETAGYGYNKKSNVCRDNVMPIKDTPGFPKSKPQLPFKCLRNVFF